MTASFEFGDTTKNDARKRQEGLCAACGEDLTDYFEHAHHVVPKQTGKGPADFWLRSADNCVVLCEDCHTAYHGHGRFATVAAPPSVFKFSHGKNQQAHIAWLPQVTLRFMSMGRSPGS